MLIPSPIPSLGLYIHSPWCWQKCPYCDFNAYQRPQGDQAMSLLEEAYLNALIKDLIATKRNYPWLHNCTSIYLGGGTPSLFSPSYWRRIFIALRTHFTFSTDIEITMEISPKTPLESLLAFREIGINRFSVGLQSFNPETLSALGREHDPLLSHQILELISTIPNTRVNVDLIYGLNSQSPHQVEEDLKTALSYPINHLSWYELMIEPNTKFAAMPHVKASEDQLAEFETIGANLLSQWDHYEISAYGRNNDKSQHNMLYWKYGDYLGLGAGAHSKVTLKPGLKTRRFYKTRYPQDYVRSQREILDPSANDLIDYLLVRLRLFTPLEKAEILILPFHAQKFLQYWWELPHDKALIERDLHNRLNLTLLGRRSVNSILDRVLDLQSDWEKSK